jgi:hypothetical protein
MLVATPTLQLSDRAPITVQIRRFRPLERVTVTVTSGHTWRKAGTTNAQGALVVSFPGTRLAPCAIYRLTAAGTKGDTAWFQSHAAMCGAGP